MPIQSRPELLAPLMKNEQKRLYKINTDYELYFMLKHMGKQYTLIQIQLFYFFFLLGNAIFMKNVAIKIIFKLNN